MLDRKNYNIFEISLCRQLTRAYNLNMAISTFFFSKCGEFFYQKSFLKVTTFFFWPNNKKDSPKKCWLRCTNYYIIELWINFFKKILFIRTYFTNTLQKLHYQKWISKWFVFQKNSLNFIKIGWKLEFNSQ